ncbi:MAG: antibiotic biosynthesis monooxygenase [Pseudanabaena sp. RU_4_16]|nr:antibiotic biosynthesis monooxygenase [Pseudanabaena sp. SU_2_4]NJM27141.1 antibiotic biosynthesis monooxygenase [Pseudanabaena sp. RU_4_16]NKB17341.1 antibiotic biosynthesis monooxygenase [Pseudanabaena sp. CRU_2_10]
MIETKEGKWAWVTETNEGEENSITSLTVIARIKSKPGMEKRMQQNLLHLLTPTRSETGCITFDLLIDINDPTVFMLYENWENQAALDAHFEQPYVKQVLEAYEVTLAEPIATNFLSKIEPLITGTTTIDRS